MDDDERSQHSQNSNKRRGRGRPSEKSKLVRTDGFKKHRNEDEELYQLFEANLPTYVERVKQDGLRTENLGNMISAFASASNLTKENKMTLREKCILKKQSLIQNVESKRGRLIEYVTKLREEGGTDYTEERDFFGSLKVREEPRTPVYDSVVRERAMPYEITEMELERMMEKYHMRASAIELKLRRRENEALEIVLDFVSEAFKSNAAFNTQELLFG
jgi:hypothetical protein